MNLTLQDLGNVLRQIGRGVVFYAPGNSGGVAGWTPGSGALGLAHLGDTEGDITFTPNGEVASLVLPEVTGPARHTATFTGEAPTLAIPLFLADPALLDVISPTSSRNGGASFRRRAKEYTLAIFPEELFLEEQVDGSFLRKTLAYTGGVWTLDAVALTPAQEAMVAQSLWLWRGFFDKAPRRFIGAPDGKNIETVNFHLLHQAEMPEGNALYTQGDPADAGIDIEGGS